MLIANIALVALAAGATTSRVAERDDAARLEQVTVTATRIATPLAEVPATVSVLTSGDIDRLVATDLKSLLRYEPGVSVRNDVGRFGLSDIVIRGIGANRVLLEVDEVRLPDAFEIGSFSSAGRDGIDIDLLKRVEIVRGSASSLYGSDALGGVVQFTTKDPADLLHTDRDLHAGAKLFYGEQDTSYGGTARVAGRSGPLSGLLAYTHRETGDYDTQGRSGATGSTRTEPNPRDGSGRSVLAKAVWQPSEQHTWKLTGEYVESDVSTDVLSALGTTQGFPPGAMIQTTQLRGQDEQLRKRLSLEHQVTSLATRLAESAEWRVYHQDSDTTQLTFEERTTQLGPSATPGRRERVFDFEQQIVGAEVTLRKSLTTGTVSHLLVYGLELTRTDTEQMRDGREINLATGAVSTVVGPDDFPVRDFPLTRTTTWAAWLQDEIRIGRLTLLPGARVDRYELEPESDLVFAADNPGIEPQSIDESSINPRFGAVWRVTERFSAFGSYSRGFRIPPYSDVNVGFTNLLFGYTAIPNPRLKPETSDSLEAGLRLVDGDAWLTLSAYYSVYDDFIESFVPVETNEQGLLVFQSQNLHEVRIRGAELSAAWPLERTSAVLRGLQARAALSYSVGDNEEQDEPLNSIDPPRAILGLQYRAPSGRWGGELVGTFVERKHRIDHTAAALFASPGYASFDLLADFRLREKVWIHVGVLNLADRKYWEWADVRGRPAADPAIDRYTRPGRTFAANVRMEW